MLISVRGKSTIKRVIFGQLFVSVLQRKVTFCFDKVAGTRLSLSSGPEFSDIYTSKKKEKVKKNFFM